MSDIALRVENLGKSYQITRAGKRGGYRTLQEDVVGFLKKPFAKDEQASAKETFWALQDVSFEVKQGEVLGIIGRNGAGKSTLLKILSRITKPTTGQVDIYGRVGSLLEVGTGFHPELTGRENIFLNGAVLGMSRRDIARQFDAIVQFAEVEQFLDTPVKRYSSGMYMRLAFAVAAHLEPEVLIVDEVLAVGDAEFQKKCLGKMGEVARDGRTVLFVSHNMAAVEALCTRAIWISEGKIVEQGSTEYVVAHYLNNAVISSTEQFYSDIEDAPGNDRIRVRRMHVSPADGESTIPITMTTPIQLEFEYWNLKPNTYLNLSLHVNTQEGFTAFSTVPVHDAQWMNNPYPEGLFRSVCYIPGYLLNSGTYRVDVLFVEDQTRIIYNITDALVFDVAEAVETHGAATWFGKWPGVLHPRIEWQTDQIDLEPMGM